MKKTELIDAISDMNDMSKKDVKEVLEATLETIKEVLAEGESVELPGFGKFYITEMKARKGRNPATGEEIDIAAKNQAKFKAGKSLKDAVN